MKLIPLLLILLSFASCELLQKEDTPLCKECYKATYSNATGEVINVENENKLCGGDVIAWENIGNEVNDSTTIKYECK